MNRAPAGRRGARPAAGRAPSLPPWAWPALAVLVALAVRLIAWQAQPFITVDGTQYVRVAEAMMSGRAQASVAPPGYSALIALVRFVQHDRVASAALVSFVCGVLLPWPVWAIARRRLGAALAVLPALAVAFHPEIARFSALTMSESSYLLAFYGALALVPAGALGSGLLLGAAYLIRPEALVAAGVLALRGAWRLTRRRTAPRHALLGVAGFLALAVPCWLWYHATLGAWTLSPKLVLARATVTDWRTVEPRLPGAELPAPAPSLAERARTLAGNVPPNARAYGGWLMVEWPAPLLLLSLAGLARGAGLEAVPLFHLLALSVLGNAERRFLLPVLPALAVLAALGAVRLRRGLALGAAALALVGVGLLWRQGARDFLKPFDGHIEAHMDAGLWLRAHSAPGEPVLDRKPYAAFYAERPYVFMPDAPYDSLVAWAVAKRVRWLVVDQGVAAVYRRQLEPLLYDGAFRDRENRLESVYVGGRVEGYGVALFKVLQPGERKSGRPPAVEISRFKSW